jgi:hypothetical protein
MSCGYPVCSLIADSSSVRKSGPPSPSRGAGVEVVPSLAGISARTEAAADAGTGAGVSRAGGRGAGAVTCAAGCGSGTAPPLVIARNAASACSCTSRNLCIVC